MSKSLTRDRSVVTLPAPPARAESGNEPDAPEPTAVAGIPGLRLRIDEIDDALVSLWTERGALSRAVGDARVAAGGPRVVLDREREILDRYRAALGADGTQLGLLALRFGRGPL